MKQINLQQIPYKDRFNGASLLVSKANRLVFGEASSESARQARLLTAVSYYDMALALTKPLDPNYPTVLNWKCNALLELGQYEEALEWYRGIIELSDATDGLGKRNATALLAEEMIAKHSGKPNAPLPPAKDTECFDTPPFCMHAEEFCTRLSERKFKQAHDQLSEACQAKLPLAQLKKSWLAMVGSAPEESLSIELQQHLVDWPARKAEDIGWCYFSVSSEEISEGLSVVVSKTQHGAFAITAVEFGRP